MIDLALDALSVYRLTRLVTTDAIMQPARDAVGRRAVVRVPHGDSSYPAAGRKPWPFLADLMRCDWCVSMWIGFGVMAARRLAPDVWQPVATALAFSTVAGLIAERT